MRNNTEVFTLTLKKFTKQIKNQFFKNVKVFAAGLTYKLEINFKVAQSQV